MKIPQFAIWVVGIGISVTVVLGGTAACSLTDLSLGPELQVTPPASTIVPQAAATAFSPVDGSAATDGLCGRQGSTTMLLLGESLPEDQPVRGASAIRLVRVDYDAGTVRVLALPPYLLVSTPALASAGMEAGVLTRVYWEALSLGTGSERARMAYASNVFAQTLADNFALVPDHYIALKQGVFIDIIDALGGLPIDLPEDVDGSPSGFPYFRAGEQVLDGQAVLDYVRIYPAAGDTEPIEWQRLVRQRQVIAALRDQIGRPETMVRLPVLVPQFYYDVVSDLSLKQILSLTCVLQESDVSIEHLSLAPDMVTVGPDHVLAPNMEEITSFLETSFRK